MTRGKEKKMNGIVIDGNVYEAVPKRSRHCSDCDLYEQCIIGRPLGFSSLCAWFAIKEMVVFRFLKELQPNEEQVPDGHTDKYVSALNFGTFTKKQTIWYNINDTPSENSEIVFMDIEGNVFNYTYSSNEDWEQVVETNEITIWAYLDDLTNL